MSTIRNTKTLAECLSLKKENMTEKLLLERIKMELIPSIKLYDRLIEVDLCWYKVDDFYFAFCSPELYFCKTKKLLYIKEYKELLEPTLDRILLFFTKISKNKTWAEDAQYDSLWKWFNQLQDVIIELDKIGHKLTAKE